MPTLLKRFIQSPAGVLAVGAFAALVLVLGTAAVGHLLNPTPLSGDFNPTGGGTYYLKASVGGSDTSFTLSSFKEPVSNIPYTMSYLNSSIEYGTLDPQSTHPEFVSFTGITQNSDGSATLTGVTRGLGRTYPFTASSTLQQPHSGQSKFILSNPPQLTNQYANLNNAQTVIGRWTFSVLPQSTVAPSAGADLVNYTTLLTTAIQGAATSTETTMGISELANFAQIGVSTASSTTGAPLVIPNKAATTTPGTPCTSGAIKCLVAASSGKISQAWLDLTAAFTFSTTTSGTLNVGTINATSSINLNGIALSPKFGGTGADGALAISSGTTTIDVGGARVFERNYSSISITGTGALTFSNVSSGGLTVILRSQGACTLTSSSLTMIDLRTMGGGNNAITFDTVSAGSGTGLAGPSGGSVKGLGSTGGSTGTFSFFTIAGAELPAIASSTRMAYPGNNGANGGPGNNGGGGAIAAGSGGTGAGALVMECGTTLTMSTGGINLSGTKGGNGSNGGTVGGGGGGGGGGGSAAIWYGTTQSGTMTINILGGAGGTAGTGGSAQGGQSGTDGLYFIAKNTYFY